MYYRLALFFLSFRELKINVGKNPITNEAPAWKSKRNYWKIASYFFFFHLSPVRLRTNPTNFRSGVLPTKFPLLAVSHR